MNFENKVFEGIYYSRFIASWDNVKGSEVAKNIMFRPWLRQLVINGKHIPEEVIQEIWQLWHTGKFELEENAKQFMKEHDNKEDILNEAKKYRFYESVKEKFD